MVTCQAFDPPPTSPAEWNIPQVIITEGLPTGWLFDVPGTPETLEVEVKYQNEVSAQLTLEPDYEEQRAHEKCPVLCETAVETIELTFITTD
jgi:hypothetical protein